MEPQFISRKSLRYPKLMIPGPVEVQESVLSAMANRVMPHYGDEWTSLYNETTDALKSVFHTDGDVFLLVGSGMCGLDAAVNSLFVPAETVVIVNNGFFGGRLVELAQSHGLKVIEANSEWGKPIDPLTVEKLLLENDNITGLITVHHETSTGVLNPIQELGKLVKQYAILLVVDAVSSLGGEELRMDEWGIDICAAASNKCLESVPGVSPVAVGRNAWKHMGAKQNATPGWYLDLRLWKRYLEEWGNWHPAPVTVATPAILALNAALEELFKEGLQNRIDRYKQTALYFRKSIEALGFKLFIDNKDASSCISAVHKRPNMDIPAMISWLLTQKNVQIAGGLGLTKGEIFRVGHMGKAGSKEYADLFLEALREYLQKIYPGSQMGVN